MPRRPPPLPPLEQMVDLLFPVQGLDISMPYSLQRPRTTAAASNVRSYEPSTNRARGGQRPGILKYVQGIVTGAGNPFCVQNIECITDTTGVGGQAGTGSISAATNANPTVCTTSVAHGLGTGQVVTIAGDTRTPSLNGNRTVTVLSTTTFSVPVDTTASGALPAGVTWAIQSVAVLTRTPPDSLNFGSMNLSNGFSNVFNYAEAVACGAQQAMIGQVAITLAGRPGDSLVWGTLGTLPGTFYGAVNLPGAQPTFTPYVGTVCSDGTNFYATSTNGLVHSVTQITTANPPVQNYTTSTTTTVTLSGGLASACAWSVVSSGVLYTVYSTGYITAVTASTGAAVAGGLLFIKPANISQAAPGYVMCGSGNAPPGSAVASGVLAVPIWNPTTGKGGVALITLSTGAVKAVTGLANTTTTGFVTTDGTAFYALFGGSADSTVVKVTTAGAVSWTTALGSPGQPGVIAYVASVTSLYVSNPLNSYSLDTSGNINGAGLGAGLLALYDGGNLTVPAPAAPGTDTKFNQNLILTAIQNGGFRVAKNGSWTLPAQGSLTFSGSVRQIFSAVNLGKIYYCDANSYQLYDPAQNKVVAWTASSGSLPRDSSNNYARLIATWQGRTVLAGLPDDPYNWFMSAIGDPTNWNYLPAATTATQAIDGTNAPAGLTAQAVTALIPYTDDLLIMGAASEIYLMRGNPMIGGSIDTVSRQMGIAWGRAFASDPSGNVYFMSNHCGIFQYTPGNQPQRISQAIDGALRKISLADVIVNMAWDDQSQGLWVFITHFSNARPETHYFWDLRSGAWWPQSFANVNHSPFCCLTYYGSTISDRVVLIGSWDGYVRAFQVNAPNDDGTAINSSVLLGPITPGNPGIDELLLKDIQAVLNQTAGQVTYSVLVGQTPEQAVLNAPVVTGTLSNINGGRNPLSFTRRSGYAIYVQLSATNPWALEMLRCRLAGRPYTGKIRGRATQI